MLFFNDMKMKIETQISRCLNLKDRHKPTKVFFMLIIFDDNDTNEHSAIFAIIM